ncbi:hypothetical protein J3E72DRAFT_380887 [Bipolaris maydis]|uniref:uncharacterized protein n=1 Tax=Cochliobolus heterostrophus TaxID=5016 RepID=UPI0024DDD336|nr:hypothetical protein BM1_04097 [Bipolaris maydis]KAJ5027500.1 hypothetical protein J3E73DRAFT_369303 [Bipolaris maydis]KAJ5058711.1 hypothetical protein J3E74DRAFT_419365 [Bipolaris maydis]KAJ6202312.1 hypothetical protein J3E72DRAFT_380887 [Bipolaris maydis]KAJ6270600.1 hypothetical protein PSV08DRAFT_401793 [Bipolaris maydis]
MASVSSTLISVSRSAELTTTALATSMTGSPATQPLFAPEYNNGVSPVPTQVIVGIAVGAVAGLAVLVAVIIFFVTRATGKKREVRVVRVGGGKTADDVDDDESVLSGYEKSVGR